VFSTLENLLLPLNPRETFPETSSREKLPWPNVYENTCLREAKPLPFGVVVVPSRLLIFCCSFPDFTLNLYLPKKTFKTSPDRPPQNKQRFKKKSGVQILNTYCLMNEVLWGGGAPEKLGVSKRFLKTIKKPTQI
jgi:hypothetical protein